MSNQLTPEEAALYEGGTLSRRSHVDGESYQHFEITSIKVIEEFDRLELSLLSSGGLVGSRSIPMRYVKIVRIGDGRIRIEGKRYGNNPLFLEPHPSKLQQAELFAKLDRKRSA